MSSPFYRRIIISAAGLIAGFVAVVTLHPTGVTISAALISHRSSPGSRPPASASGTGGKSGSTDGPQAPTTSAPSVTSTTQGPATTTSTSQPSQGPQSAQGALEQYGYGELAVKVTVSNSKITDVSVTTLQVAESYSGNIAQQAVPMLRHEVLSQQSANIYGISGATYTSQAYAASVQSALSKLHFA